MHPREGWMDVKGTRGQKRTEREGREIVRREEVGASSGRRWDCSN